MANGNVIALTATSERPASTYSGYAMPVVLCGERDTQPVVNTGTLYQ